ncbi:ribosome assembly cofactor RimP [Algibacter luteus]|uniref:Ribosome maturation factor RimP n=1 Tax=Algibacter luteus TaxID=1178825 RepID=A0A1M6DVG4_9FLAO|nr:ribosome assembly cofactor RimP [Algibacter luteus]SHI77247.1 ribosome maturation factor RimP [Algibacter luteus]
MFKNKVTELLDTALIERPDLFLIDFTINSENHIKVIIDGDHGVLVEDCMFISRAIEHNLDREEEDFSLEVMSAGAASPLTHKRQYKKNLERTLKVRTASEEIEGKLTKATEDNITLEWKVREPKPVGKGKITVNKEANVPYENIVEAKVMIKF